MMLWLLTWYCSGLAAEYQRWAFTGYLDALPLLQDELHRVKER